MTEASLFSMHGYLWGYVVLLRFYYQYISQVLCGQILIYNPYREKMHTL